MKRTVLITSVLPALFLAGTVAPAAAAPDGRPDTYVLTGDPSSNGVGSKFEGIGADERRGRFYVSEVTGGEIHRGTIASAQTEEWLASGADGRFTARGITVDAAGRVYIAGGPNGIGTGRPDLWVYSPEGELLTALRVPGAPDAFLNDVAIGPDGAAYFTNSNDPQVFRVALEDGSWRASLWADATGTVTRTGGFNLGGIVLTPDNSGFVVAQGNVGRLWRFDTRTAAVTEVATGGADLVNADGLVLRGEALSVVRNFSRMLTILEITADGRSAVLVRQQATDPSRVLTTAKVLRGKVLYVDSKFDEPVASGPYEVVTDPLVR